MNIDMDKFIVRNSDNSVNMDATCTKFAGTVTRYLAERETEISQIANAVNGVFDAHRGQSLLKGPVVHATLTALNVQADNYVVLGKKVDEYLKNNTQYVTKDHPNREPGKLFRIIKGPTGGMSRWSDVPLSESEIQEAAARAAANPPPPSPEEITPPPAPEDGPIPEENASPACEIN